LIQRESRFRLRGDYKKAKNNFLRIHHPWNRANDTVTGTVCQGWKTSGKTSVTNIILTVLAKEVNVFSSANKMLFHEVR
jgi:hypothetical protein